MFNLAVMLILFNLAGVAFDQGNQLSIPERVPFRLTRDLVDGLGVTGKPSYRNLSRNLSKALKASPEPSKLNRIVTL